MHPKSVRRIFRFFPSLLKHSVYVENFARKRYLEVKKIPDILFSSICADHVPIKKEKRLIEMCRQINSSCKTYCRERISSHSVQ